MSSRKRVCIRREEPEYAGSRIPVSREVNLKTMERCEEGENLDLDERTEIIVSGDGCYTLRAFLDSPCVLYHEFLYSATIFINSDHYFTFFFADSKKIKDFDRGVFIPWPLAWM